MKKTALLFAVVLLVWAVNASKDKKKEGRKKRGLFDHVGIEHIECCRRCCLFSCNSQRIGGG